MTIDCRSFTAGKCTNPDAVKLYGDRPSFGVHKICPHRTGGSSANDVLSGAVQVTISPISAIPRSQWPAFVIAIADAADPEDRGIGDVIDRKLGAGGLAFKALAALAWKACGCGNRRDALNAKYPLNSRIL